MRKFLSSSVDEDQSQNNYFDIYENEALSSISLPFTEQRNKLPYLLVAEDNAIELNVLKILLFKKIGLNDNNIIFCKDGLTAYNKIAENFKNYQKYMNRTTNNEQPPELLNLLLIDYSMPGMNGLDLIAKIKSEYKDSGIPMPKVVMNSGLDDDNLKTAAQNEGVDYWIVKKDLEKLQQLIKSILI